MKQFIDYKKSWNEYKNHAHEICDDGRSPMTMQAYIAQEWMEDNNLLGADDQKIFSAVEKLDEREMYLCIIAAGLQWQADGQPAGFADLLKASHPHAWKYLADEAFSFIENLEL